MCNATMDIALLDQPASIVEWSPVLPGGAECNFLGRTRPESHPDHGALVALDYETYRTMAQRTLEELARTAASTWPCLGIRIHHALGAVPIGDASVFISVICPHRGDAFDACRWLIDTLKKQAPIWKQERWADGTSWAPGHTPTAAVDT
jgi:molybdopterin synthase catalytic subunit